MSVGLSVSMNARAAASRTASSSSRSAASKIRLRFRTFCRVSEARRKVPVAALYDKLAAHGLDFYTGVPDSLLKDFCAYVSDTSRNHVIAANEVPIHSSISGPPIENEAVPIPSIISTSAAINQ